MQKETILLRDLQGCELEVEQLRTKKQVLEKQLESASQNSKGLNQQHKEQKKEFDQLAEEIKQLRETKQELSADIRQIETKYFAEFCKTANVKNVLEYENKLFGREEEGGNSHPSLL
jgi:septal ring factor EnvC (AmiA/AmiB activator)